MSYSFQMMSSFFLSYSYLFCLRPKIQQSPGHVAHPIAVLEAAVMTATTPLEVVGTDLNPMVITCLQFFFIFCNSVFILI